MVLGVAYNTRNPALHVAAYHGDLIAIELLLERGAAIDSTANPKGMTPLILSAITGQAMRARCCWPTGCTRGHQG